MSRSLQLGDEVRELAEIELEISKRDSKRLVLPIYNPIDKELIESEEAFIPLNNKSVDFLEPFAKSKTKKGSGKLIIKKKKKYIGATPKAKLRTKVKNGALAQDESPPQDMKNSDLQKQDPI